MKVIVITPAIIEEKELATIGGTPAGIFISHPFSVTKIYILPITKPTISATNNELDPKYAVDIAEIGFSTPSTVTTIGVNIKNETNPKSPHADFPFTLNLSAKQKAAKNAVNKDIEFVVAFPTLFKTS